MYSVYCLPVEREDSPEPIDFFDIINEFNEVVFSGTYHECCDIIDSYAKDGLVFYS